MLHNQQNKMTYFSVRPGTSFTEWRLTTDRYLTQTSQQMLNKLITTHMKEFNEII